MLALDYIYHREKRKIDMEILFWIIFAILVVAIVGMIVAIGRDGDERRKFIVEKASAQTFYIGIGILILDCVYTVVTDNVARNSSPIMLVVLAIVFLIELAHLFYRYGE